jgi:hypothetical protein
MIIGAFTHMNEEPYSPFYIEVAQKRGLKGSNLKCLVHHFSSMTIGVSSCTLPNSNTHYRCSTYPCKLQGSSYV